MQDYESYRKSVVIKEDYWQYVNCPVGDMMDGNYTYDDINAMYDIYTPSDADRAALRDAIKFLTPRQQEILKLHLKGYTQQKICEELGLSEQSTVHKHLYGDPNNGGGILKKLKTIINGRKCKKCGERIPDTRGMQAKYCSEECRHHLCKCGKIIKKKSTVCIDCWRSKSEKQNERRCIRCNTRVGKGKRYCTKCRKERKRECARNHHNRKSAGKVSRKDSR